MEVTNFMIINKVVLIIILIYLVLINIIGFSAMGIDKNKAQKHKWRIPEKTLFLFPILGGSLGGLIGMHVFHHKTKHWYFRFGFPAILFIQIAAITYLFVAHILLIQL